MAEPQVRYCTTSDGVSIAFHAMGSGPPLILSSPFTFSHIGLEMQFPPARALYERFAAKHTLVRWDPRNYGLSQRGVDVDFGRWALDIEAVADKLGFDRFDLVALNWGSVLQVRPERMRRLVLAPATPIRGADLLADPEQAAVRSLAEKNWDVYTETLANFLQGWDGDNAHAYALFMRESINQADYLRGMASWRTWDVSPFLPGITCPTLIVASLETSKGARVSVSAKQSSLIASAIPNARLTQIADFRPLNPKLADLIEEFLDEEPFEGSSARPSASASSGMAVILFTDIVSSTELTERMGDAAFREVSRALDAGLRGAIRECGGTTVEAKTLGDGVLATFGSAAQAIEGARRCLALSAASELGLHIGVHAGDVIREEGNVFGGAVNIASRICGLSAAGEILVSDVVRGMARSSAGVVFEDRGEQEMKGVGEPVRVYAVRTEGA